MILRAPSPARYRYLEVEGKADASSGQIHVRGLGKADESGERTIRQYLAFVADHHRVMLALQSIIAQDRYTFKKQKEHVHSS